METKRDYHVESQAYLKELRSRFQDQPEKLSRFYKVMQDIRDQRDEQSGRLETVPDHILARVKVILKGHCDLIRGFNIFLPPSRRFGIDDDGDNDCEAVMEEDDETESALPDGFEDAMEEDEETGQAALPDGYEDAKDFLDRLRMRTGGKVWEDFVGNLSQYKDKRDLYKVILPMCGDDTDLLKGFYRVMIASGINSVASNLPDSQDKDVSNGGAVITKAAKKQKKPEKIDQVGEESGKERKLLKAGGSAAEAGGWEVEQKLNQDGICFFENVRKKLSCEMSFYNFSSLFYYYTERKIGRAEWKEKVAAVIGKYPELMDEFRSYVRDCENVLLFSEKVEEEDEVQKIETRHCEKRDRLRGKYLNKSVQELDLSQCKRFSPSYLYLPEDYCVPSKGNKMEPELQVLNNQFLSLPSGTEDFFTRNSDENEKILFQCEDYRYETDMLICWFSSAVEYAVELEKLGNADNEIKKGNRTIFLRCIERLYDDQGLEVLHIFKEDPQHVIPILKVRLVQKLKDLKDYRDELQKLWRSVYARH